MGFTVELYWRCTHEGPHGRCGELNPGRSMRCSKCGFEKTADAVDGWLKDGTPVGDGETFTLSAEQAQAESVADASLIALAARGETWVCVPCGSDNRPSADGPAEDICSRCGAPRLATGMDRGKAERVMTARSDFDEARAHENGADRSDGPPPEDPFAAEHEARGLRAGDTVRELLAAGHASRMAAARTALLFGAIVAGVMALAVAAYGAWWLLAPHQVHAHVESAHWSRTERLLRRYTHQSEGWGTPPASAYQTSCERRDTGRTERCHPYDCNPHPERYVARTERVQTGTRRGVVGTKACTTTKRVKTGSHKCNCRPATCTKGRNGFGSCSGGGCDTCDDWGTREVPSTCDVYGDVPVYGDKPIYDTHTVFDTCWQQCPVFDAWCTYLIDSWAAIDSRTASGNGTGAPPQWPGLAAAGPDERIERSASYQVTFAGDKGTAWSKDVGEDDFDRFAPGSRWLLSVSRAGTVSIIQPE